MLSVTNKHIMLSVVMLNVIMLSIIMLSVVAPSYWAHLKVTNKIKCCKMRSVIPCYNHKLSDYFWHKIIGARNLTILLVKWKDC